MSKMEKIKKVSGWTPGSTQQNFSSNNNKSITMNELTPPYASLDLPEQAGGQVIN
jgi:hypothetical protein